MRKKSLLLLLVMVLLSVSISLVYASTTTTFADGSSTKEFYFPEEAEMAAYVKLPRESAITTATINLKDISWPWQMQDDADSYYAIKGGWDGLSSERWAYIYSNYSKPVRGYDGTMWMLKHGSDSSPIIENATLPTSCWQQEPIQVKGAINLGDAEAPNYNYTTYGACFDGNSWINITSQPSKVTAGSYQVSNPSLAYDNDWSNAISIANIYWVKTRMSNYVFGIHEEAMQWFTNMTNTTNLKIDVGNDSTIEYQNDSLWDGQKVEQNGVSLNASQVEGVIWNCSCEGCSLDGDICTFPLSFYSKTEGELKISGLNIGYCAPSWIPEYDVCTTQDNKLMYYIDENVCGTLKGLPSDNGTNVDCDYCGPQIINVTTIRNATGCRINDTILQEAQIISYDENQSVCYEITGLPSDFYENRTLWGDNTEITCNYCDSDWMCSNYDSSGHCLDVIDVSNCYEITFLVSDSYQGDMSEFTTDPNQTNIKNVSDAVNGTSSNGTIINDTIVVYIGNNPVNEWTTVTGILNIDLVRGNKMIAEFDYNFTFGDIDFNQVMIDEGNDNNGATKGYIVLRGIDSQALFNETKTLYINRIDTKMNWVCIKDAELNDISEISKNCKGSNEYHVQCNGQEKDGYVCSYNETLDQYKITGLRHSGVIQMGAPTNDPSQETYSASGGAKYSSSDQENNQEDTNIETEIETTVEEQTEGSLAGITGAVIGFFKTEQGMIALGFIGVVVILSFITFAFSGKKK